MDENLIEAQWIRMGEGDEEHFKCSSCKMMWFLAYGDPFDNEMYFCPRCGVRMGREVV